MNGACEEKISRGRRFFMLGALALPVAAQIARVGKLVAPAPVQGIPFEFHVIGGSNIQVGDTLWTWNGLINPNEKTEYKIMRVNADYSCAVSPVAKR